MKEINLVEGALTDVLEGTNLFRMIKEDIDDFIGKYDVDKWLSLNQVSTIHEILMSGDISRLDKYRELQLRRQSEKDRWQKEVNGKKAIDHFCEMVEGLLKRCLRSIQHELEKRFRLSIDSYISVHNFLQANSNKNAIILPENNIYYRMIYQNFIRFFDYIFVTKMRVLKEDAPCLKD